MNDVSLSQSVAEFKREILTKYYVNSPSQSSLRASSIPPHSRLVPIRQRPHPLAHLLSDPSRKIDPNHPVAFTRFMAAGALQKDGVMLSEIFAPNSSNRVFFAISKSLPWNESGEEVKEDESCPVDKDRC